MALNARGIVIAGLVSSIIMGMLSMMGEAFAGAGFWAPPTLIAATILRDLQGVSVPVPFLFVPLMLGLMGHMMNSVILTGVFEAVVGQRITGTFAYLVAGMFYGALVFFAMWFMALPVIDPAMLQLNSGIFGIAHLMWGVALAATLLWTKQPSTQQPQPANS